MNLQRWILQRKPDWDTLEDLLNRINTKGLRSLSSEELLSLGSLYKATSADLSRARVKNVGEPLKLYLNNLVSKAHNYVYRQPPMRFRAVVDFVWYEFPATFRQCFLHFVIAFSVFWIGAVLAMTTVHIDPSSTSHFFIPDQIVEDLRAGTLWTDRVQANPLESYSLMSNNISVAFKAFVYGILFGIGTIYFLFMNGFVIGGGVQVVIENGLGDKILTFISSHGVIELTSIYIAGAAGLLIGWALVNPGEHKRWDSVYLKSVMAFKLILGCALLLIIAGTIEGLISPNPNIPETVKFMISLTSGLLLILYFTFAGRKPKKAEELPF